MHSSLRLPLAALAAALLLAQPALADIPQFIAYQGRVVQGTQNFEGTGYFKFALVDGGTGATYWSNDGTSASGSEPATAISLPVKGGNYSINLGQTGTAGATQPVTPGVFNHPDVRLRKWFRPAATGPFTRIDPDDKIGAVAYAILAASVPDGSITAEKIANGAVTADKIADGAVTADKIAPGAAAASLGSGFSLVPAGGMVLSEDSASANLVAAGYVKSRALPAVGAVWMQRTAPAAANSPSARSAHAAVWTGSEMIIWGGTNGTSTATGSRYNPATNTWTTTSTTGAPAARYYHSAVWTGTEMIIFGGAPALSDGARYNPATNTWTALPASGLAGRHYHSAVWTGGEMIIFGGWNGSTYYGDGARYKPATNTWTTLPAAGAPAARASASAAWTGTDLVVFGGNAATAFGNGARWTLTTNTWTALPTAGAPSARTFAASAWSGTDFIVWGGFNLATFPTDGARWTAATNTWTPLSTTAAPAGRWHASSLWTGKALLVFGGTTTAGNNPAGLNTGGLYFPATDTWEPIPAPSPGPAPRTDLTALSTGSDILVFGGWNSTGPVNDGLWSFTTPRALYLYRKL